jgi:hypothetical protein
MPRIISRGLLTPARRFLSTTTPRLAFATGPAPPRLPAKEQEEFERLQKASTGAFSTPRSPPQINQSPDSLSTINQSPQVNQAAEADINIKVRAAGEGDELHPDIRRGAKPEFEGEVNPKTGEVGGPKNEPMRWGHNGDWSFNGRVTDF